MSSIQLPDVYDPNFHCKPCNYTYQNIVQFRDHLRLEHSMPLSRVSTMKGDPNIEPDPTDPKFYCKSCNKTYRLRACYQNQQD